MVSDRDAGNRNLEGRRGRTASRSGVHAAIAAAAAGAALALALPGLGLVPLALLFPGLLLEAIRSTRTTKARLALGWLAGLVHWIVAASWVTSVMHGYGGLPLSLAIVCLLAMAAYLGVSWAAVTLISGPAPPPLRPWVMSFAFCAIEAFRQLPPYAFPWNPVASALAGQPSLLGSLPVWGATGLGWAVTALGAGSWSLLRAETRRSGLALIGTAITLTAAATLMAPDAQTSETPIRAAVIQPATLLEERWDPSRWDEVMQRVHDLTIEAARHDPDIVLWPEGAVPFVVDTDPDYRRWLTDLAARAGAPIVVNSVGRTSSGGSTNSVYVVPAGRAGRPPAWTTWQRYDKVRLVPFGEYVPVLARAVFSESLVREVGRFVPGDGQTILEINGHGVGMAICYEIVFPDLVASQERLGAELLTTVTNDGWYGESWAPRQHLAQAVLRAVEGRRWLARAALTGISGVVDPTGRVVRRLELGEHGLAMAEVYPATGLTPRTRLGDWWGLLSAVFCLALLFAPRLIRRTDSSHGPGRT